MSALVQLSPAPFPSDSPIRLLDSDPKPKRWLATIEGKRYSVIVSRDNVGRDGPPDYRWHVSVAGSDSVPPWAHFAQIVHEVRPGITFCVPMPPASYWMNVNPNVLHVWELRDEPLAAQWRSEGLGNQVT